MCSPDAGFVVGGLTAGIIADLAGSGGAIALVAALTAASGVVVARTHWHGRPNLPEGEGDVVGSGRLP